MSKKLDQQDDKVIRENEDVALFLKAWEPALKPEMDQGNFRRMLCSLILSRRHQQDDPRIAGNAVQILQAMSRDLEEDVLMALRYAYYVEAKPLVADATYDTAEAAYLQRDDIPEDSGVMNPGSDNAKDYSKSQHALALYMHLRQLERFQQEPNP